MRKSNYILFFVSFTILSFALFVNYQPEKTLDEIDGHLNTGVTYTLPGYISPSAGEVLRDDGYGILSWESDKSIAIDKIFHHPVYGSYLEEVPFDQGMTLYPGQSAVFGIDISFEVTGDTTYVSTEIF